MVKVGHHYHVVSYLTRNWNTDNCADLHLSLCLELTSLPLRSRRTPWLCILLQMLTLNTLLGKKQTLAKELLSSMQWDPNKLIIDAKNNMNSAAQKTKLHNLLNTINAPLAKLDKVK